MNLFELFFKIGVDDQASGAIGTLTDKLGGGLKTAAKIGIDAVAAAATGIAALTKGAIENYAEYEQLVGGVDTLFKNASDQVQEYAARAYQTAGMSANDYMETVTSFSAALIQSLASNTSDAESMTVESVEESRDKQLEILKESSAEAVELLKEAQEEEVYAFEKATDEKIALINKQYNENIKLIDEERYRQIKYIDEQIDALNAQTEAERAAIAERETQQRISELKKRVETAKTAEERKKAEEALSEYLADVEQKRVESNRKAQIEALKEEKAAINERAAEQKAAAKEEKDAAVATTKEKSKEQLRELKKSQEEEMAALKSHNEQKKLETEAYFTSLIEDIEAAGAATEISSETYAKAASVADQAIIDMADNANKMGSDISMIQNALTFRAA